MENREELQGVTEQQEKGKRPQLLAVLLVFSMVNGVLSAVSNIFLYGVLDMVREMFAGQDQMNFMGMEIDMTLFLNTDKNFFLYQGLLYAVSFTGALMMWKFKKIGFHLYTLSQILLLILVTVYLPGLPFPYLDVMITAFFVYVYAKNLPLMQD